MMRQMAKTMAAWMIWGSLFLCPAAGRAGSFGDALVAAMQQSLAKSFGQGGLQGGAASGPSNSCSYEDRFQGRTIDVELGYPFLLDGNVVTSLAHLCGQSVLGKAPHLVQLRILNKEFRIARFRVTAVIPGLSREVSETVQIEPDESKVVGLSPVFGREVAAIVEKTPGVVKVRVFDEDGKQLFQGSKPVQVLAKNDLILSAAFWPFVATFVTPNHQAVDRLVTRAAEALPSRAISGYQSGDPAEVGRQVNAIYDEIQRLGVHYRSNTNSFMNARGASAQRITYPGDSVEGKGANCIDGAVLFASAFENAGLDPCIVIVPGHAFVGVALEPAGKVNLFIETTMVGKASFREALDSGNATFRDASAKGEAQVISVRQARRCGISPFPYGHDAGEEAVQISLPPPPSPAEEEKLVGGIRLGSKASALLERCEEEGIVVLDGPSVDGLRCRFLSRLPEESDSGRSGIVLSQDDRVCGVSVVTRGDATIELARHGAATEKLRSLFGQI